MAFSNRSKFLAIGLSAALTASCAGTPIQPDNTIPQKTETFSGSIKPGQIASFPFAVLNPGSVTVTLAAWSPAPGPAMGLGLGAWDNANTKCNEQLSSSSAKVNTILTGNPQQAGTYCVALYDLGNLEVESTFTLTVQHY